MKNVDIVTVIVVVCIAVLLALGVLGGILAVKADAAQKEQLELYEVGNKGYYDKFIIVDSVTGVNYVVIECCHKAVSITPRLNADGSLYVSK